MLFASQREMAGPGGGVVVIEILSGPINGDDDDDVKELR